jgi:putative ABC transport system permease protein
MFRSYLRIAVRSLSRQRLYTSINIFGLAVGLAICLIVIGHLSYELSFEDCHKNRDRIWRVNLRYQEEDSQIYSANVMPALGPALGEELPEVEKVALFRVLGNVNLKVGEESFIPQQEFMQAGYKHGGNVLCATPDFLDVFTFPLLQGNPETVLSEPFSVIVTEKAVQKYFHGLDPIGQTVRLNDSLHCQITGVLRDVPENTQLYCEFIVSYSTLERMGQDIHSWEKNQDDYVYLLLNEGADWAGAEQKIPGIFQNYVSPEEFSKYSFELQQLENIYFNIYGSGRWGDLNPGGESSMIWTLAITALAVLLIAITNFVNLSTARSANRMKEVGVRKVFGAFRTNLVRQFLGESFVITSVSFLIGLAIYEVFKHSITSSLPREAFADFYNNWMMLLFLMGLLVAVGVLAGYYPALYLSRFKPIAVLQSKSSSRSSKSFLRKALVVFQFAIAIGFVCCTIIIFKQFDFVSNAELGFQRENILILNFEGDDAADKCMLMKSEILSTNRVLSATAANTPPGRRSWNSYGFYTDETREEMKTADTYLADYDFMSTFDLKIAKGRGFSVDYPADVDHGIIINESFVKDLNLDNPIGHKLYGGEDVFYEVIGVVEDFHGSPMDYSYKPFTVIMLRPEQCFTVSILLPPDDIAGSLAAIEATWEKTLPGETFDYSFLDEEISHNYDSDKGIMKLMAVLSGLTIAIACLGVLALVSFSAEQRTKEIGIRKVLGASVSGIVMLLSKEFIVLIAIATAFAWPLAYLAMTDFLNEFALRVNIGVDTFIMTAVLAIAIALFTASFQAIRAAQANPVNAIQHE